ncbi:MAG TPA: helix-turn-helix domain-containing protein, partial [Chitinophagaceae bacterium]
KGETNRITLKLFRAGKTIAEIAAERSLAASTIETHLASFVPTGEIDVLELINREKLDRVISYLENQPASGITSVKQSMGESVTYAEIKAAMKYFEKISVETDH